MQGVELVDSMLGQSGSCVWKVLAGKGGKYRLARNLTKNTTIPPFSESSIKTVLNQSAKNPDFSRQRNQSPHKREQNRRLLKLEYFESHVCSKLPKSESCKRDTCLKGNQDTEREIASK
jgi:hypothetical protein